MQSSWKKNSSKYRFVTTVKIVTDVANFGTSIVAGITRAEKGGFMNGVLTAVHERDRS